LPVNSTSPTEYIARGVESAVIVLSHSCEIDKEERKARVLVAPVRAASTLTDATREKVFAGQRYSFVPLLAVPVLGECYVDLRNLLSVNKNALVDRIASMTPDGIETLQTRLIGFFTRRG